MKEDRINRCKNLSYLFFIFLNCVKNKYNIQTNKYYKFYNYFYEK